MAPPSEREGTPREEARGRSPTGSSNNRKKSQKKEEGTQCRDQTKEDSNGGAIEEARGLVASGREIGSERRSV